MGRPQLASLLEPRGNEAEASKKLDEQPTLGNTSPESVSEKASEAPKQIEAKRAVSSSPRKKPKVAAKAPASDIPPYLRFERKEARLRVDQLTALTIKARELNKLKDADTDRITDNTLIRIAVDLLLSRVDDLAGGDEDALRQSVGA